MGAGSSSLPADHDHRTWNIEQPLLNERSILSGYNLEARADRSSVNTSQGTQTLGYQATGLAAPTDWPSRVSNPLLTANSMSAHQEKMELSRTVSHLASANQQLAAAHNLTLRHLQWFFTEFRGQPDAQKGTEKQAKAPYSNCCCKDIITKGKARVVLRKQSIAAKSMNKRLRKLRKLSALDKSKNIDVDNINPKSKEVENALRKEIKDLNNFKLESQNQNDRLMSDLEEQRLLIERLTQDFENLRGECEKKEQSLEQTSLKLSKSELESARLLVELETFQCEKSNMERIVKEEAETSSRLKARLAEQDEERKKQLLALDEATQQIRALELAIEANSQSDNLSIDIDSSPSKSEESSDSNNSPPPSSLVPEEFKKELMLKREARQRAIAAISSEMDRLRRELENEQIAHSETTKLLENLKEAQANAAAKSKTDADDLEMKTVKKNSEREEALRLADLLKISDEVTSDLWLQLERTDDLRFQLENDPDEHRLRISSLKRLSEETRAVLRSRKQQVNVLKDRFAQILVRLGDRCFLDASDEIKEETERLVEDITRSRNLCDERSRILAELKDHCFKENHEIKLKLENSRKDNASLEEDLRKTEDKMDTQDAEILNLESQLGLAKADCRDLQNQMSVINSLFTQMLLSASSAEMDLDRLTRLLQENHDLISGMAKESSTEAAALPKLLLDIIEQVDGRNSEIEEKKEDDLQEENIANNLPKVWRILLELLSCHAAGTNSPSVAAEPTPDSCYKSVDTPTGPRLVISVSKTYIRLKELILEKKHLEKEMNRMKQLNTHLETKLVEQEKRLSTVSDELSKTWNIVGRMQVQHQQLHTHEKILRYELQQKRKMLQELKQELEYCREKWESARQKNTNTEIQWRSLRREFAARKALVTHADSFNNSGESGFSDEREEESDENEDEEEIGKRVRPINSRKRSRKESARATISPDTESELPTDTEFSESKTPSSSVSRQRTPTPESDADIEISNVIEQEKLPTGTVSDNSQNSEAEILDPLDKALSTVIRNLMETDTSNYTETEPTSEEVKTESIPPSEDNTKYNQTDNISESKNELKTEINEEIAKTNVQTVANFSVFTIGPFPNEASAAKNVQFSNPLVIGPSTMNVKYTQELSTKVTCSSKEDNLKEVMNNTRTESSHDIDNISIDSSSSLETVRECPSNHGEKIDKSDASTSKEIASEAQTKSTLLEQDIIPQMSTIDLPSTEVLDARAERLRSLEEQAEWLVKKVSDTNRRGSVLSSRLEELHETYGSMPTAPPMPDVLPAIRIRTEMNERSSANDNSEHSVQPSDREEEKDDVLQ